MTTTPLPWRRAWPKGKVFIGAGGGEFGVRGWIAAYDAETGKEAWRFWTVPGDPAKGFETPALEKAAKTWRGEWWKSGGGGSIWDAAVYDPVTDLLYFGTGNGAPWSARERARNGADNLYVASIIAVKPDTGEYVWHYQETPADAWDYDAVSPMMTVDLTIEGKQQHVILQPSKNGFFYVLEAATGKLISADPFTEVNWAKGVDMKTGRPDVVPAARYEKEPWNLAPGVQGGHAWHPNAFSPETGLIYIPTWEAYFTMASLPPNSAATTGGAGGAFNLGVDFNAKVDPGKLKPYGRDGITGRLKAWDPVARKVVWETTPFVTDTRSGRPTGGVLATAGNLVFMGAGQGKELRAYDAKTGAQLWSAPTQTIVFAAPITYELDGVQYIVASVGRCFAGQLLRTELRSHAGVQSRRQGRAARTAAVYAAAAGSARSDRFGRCHQGRWREVCAVLLDLPWRRRPAGSQQLSEPDGYALVAYAGGFRSGGAEGCPRRQGHGLFRAVPETGRCACRTRVSGVACQRAQECPASTATGCARTGHAPASHEVARHQRGAGTGRPADPVGHTLLMR